jgi:hypothetical protein
MWCNNAALLYIDYITKIVCKSVKVLPVAVLGALVQGRRYSLRFYVAVLLLAAGLVIFLKGESASPDHKAFFHPLGK